METVYLINSVTVWIVILINILLTLAVIQRINQQNLPRSPQTPTMLKSGDKAPDFVIDALDGSLVSRTQYLGQKLVMFFISAGCDACSEHMPKIYEIYSTLQASDANLAIVSLSTREETSDYISKFNFSPTLPILVASIAENSLQRDYQIPKVPSYYLIDKDGIVSKNGFLEGNWPKTVANWIKVM